MLEKIQKFQATDVELEYQLTGKENKETILFVHGIGSNLRQFNTQQQYFSEAFRVLSVSLRGHGNSSNSKHNSPEAYTLIKNRDDILQLVECLKIEKMHYVGNSAGGLIGYEIFRKRPDLFSSFITFGTTAELKLPTIAVNFISNIDRLMLKAIPEGYITFLSKHSSPYRNVQKEIYHLFSSMGKGILMRKNIGNYSYIQTIEKMSIPYLLIQSELDTDINKKLKTTIGAIKNNENSLIIKLERAGHFANLDQPKAFNQIIEDFIRRSAHWQCTKN